MIPRVTSLLSLSAIVLSLGATMSAYAQHMNAVDAPCKGAGTGGDQANCLSIAAKTADANLNALYRRIISVLAPRAQQELKDAQRSWLTYRDQTCAAEYKLFDGGTGGNTAYPACLEAVTRHRAADLKAAYWWKVEKFGE